MRVDRTHDVRGRQALGLKGGQVNVDLNLALLSSVRIGSLRALDGGQLGTNRVLAGVKELLLVEAVSRESQQQNGYARRVVLNDERRSCAPGEGCAVAPG